MSITIQRAISPAPGAAHAADEGRPSSMDAIGFELGWDFARYAAPLRAPYSQEPSALLDGFTAGQVAFSGRNLPDRAEVLQWLELRLHAWLHGRHFELFQVTPHYLRQLQASHCPITRVELQGLNASCASFDRVRSDAAYAAGNLVVMSGRANRSKATYGYQEALARANQVAQARCGGVEGLDERQWHRVATLCSFLEPMAHEEACRIPMRLLPPKRLLLLNPAQALQAFVSQQLLQAGWSHRISRFESLLSTADLRRDFKRFFMALLPRVIEAGRPSHPMGLRWAIEDAWAHSGVLERWIQFAMQLRPAQCEALLVQATKKGLGTCLLDKISSDQATEGWSLQTRGYVSSNHAEQAPVPMQLSLLG